MRPFLLQVVIGVTTSVLVYAVIGGLRARREAAAATLPQPPAPGHDTV